jgi:hypothetical protein
MRLISATATLLAAASLSSEPVPAQPSPGSHALPCVARVIQSEELPYAPIGFWLVRVILEITPRNGNAYLATLQDYMPWQGSPPRRRQTFRLLCDPAEPSNLRLISRPGAPAPF